MLPDGDTKDCGPVSPAGVAVGGGAAGGGAVAGLVGVVDRTAVGGVTGTINVVADAAPGDGDDTVDVVDGEPPGGGVATRELLPVQPASASDTSTPGTNPRAPARCRTEWRGGAGGGVTNAGTYPTTRVSSTMRRAPRS
jgi:hypothetical protein